MRQYGKLQKDFQNMDVSITEILHNCSSLYIYFHLILFNANGYIFL